jgi:hypothetical protein
MTTAARVLNTVLASLLVYGLVVEVRSGHAQAGRDASTASLGAILEALQILEARVNALAADLRPASNGQARLLFPNVITSIGGTTDVYIANVGLEPSGTLGATGACSISLVGEGGISNQPLTHTLPSFQVPVGSVRRQTIGEGLVLGFGGYALATCDFPMAHGTWAVLQNGVPQFGGSALVLPPSRAADVVESLGQ